ncbi:histidine phosphatase family protein, partial [Pseudomonas chlororaphis]|nr:histidine phosphatase family protein [Pseudomonas chlororaphis]
MKNLLSFTQRLQRRSYVFFPALMLTSALLLSLESSESRAQPVDGTQTLIFLRHAEKPAGGLGQLNCQGLNRAIDLASLLPEKFGKANYVFAANPTRNVEEGELDNSYSYIRPLMTISPSAIKLGLPVNIEFSANEFKN